MVTKKELDELQEKAKKFDEMASTKTKEEVEKLEMDTSQLAEEEEDFNCSKCNAVVQKGQEKCGSCGAELDWASLK